MPGLRKALEGNDGEVTAMAAGKEIVLKMSLSRRQRDILLAGGLLPYTVQGRKGV
jgi:aconitate hydratase